MSAPLPARDAHASATFVAEVLGAVVDGTSAHAAVRAGGSIVLEFARRRGTFPTERRTVLVDEDGFDAAYGRLLDRRVRIWADAEQRRPTEIAHRAGGRGLCFAGLDDHLIELVTTPRATDDRRGRD